MTEMQESYMWWMHHIVGADQLVRPYTKLFRTLYFTEFQYTIPMDCNREADGIELRYRFADENGMPHPIIASELDICPVSLLEVLVALSVRIEESTMGDPDKGLNPGKWFWIMLENMGIKDQCDRNFNPIIVADRVERMLWRKYDPDGSNGGLFVLQNPRADLRKTEIWYQAMWYLSENYI